MDELTAEEFRQLKMLLGQEHMMLSIDDGSWVLHTMQEDTAGGACWRNGPLVAGRSPVLSEAIRDAVAYEKANRGK